MPLFIKTYTMRKTIVIFCLVIFNICEINDFTEETGHFKRKESIAQVFSGGLSLDFSKFD